jgi:hypothetical protein
VRKGRPFINNLWKISPLLWIRNYLFHIWIRLFRRFQIRITIVVDPKLFVSYLDPAFQNVSDPYHDCCGSGIVFYIRIRLFRRFLIRITIVVFQKVSYPYRYCCGSETICLISGSRFSEVSDPYHHCWGSETIFFISVSGFQKVSDPYHHSCGSETIFFISGSGFSKFYIRIWPYWLYLMFLKSIKIKI